MKVSFPLRAKIGLFAVLLVAGVAAATWVFAIYQPALEAREAREAEYTQLALMLGASGALPTNALTNKAIHPDLAYVVRAHGGAPTLQGSIAHPDRLAPLDPKLAQAWDRKPSAALAELYPLRSGARAGLVVKSVTLRGEGGDDQLLFGFSTRALDEELAERLLSSALVLAAALVLAIAGAMLLGSMVSRPVHALVAAMERIGQGNYEPVQVASRDEVGLLARAFNGMVHGLRERERLRGTLARYVSDDVAARILTEQSDLDIKGELRHVTVLFLDIRGFTALSERMSPRELVLLLNEYFEIVIEVIFKHHGTVNKFIGDAIMAIFGAPAEVEDAPMRAVQAAVEIQQRVAMHNHQRRSEGKQVISIGIGINTGQAIAGNIGSERRMEYTVIGDEVNLAQRLEGLAREGEVLVSQACYAHVEGRVEARGRDPIPVKGKTLPVQVFEIVGLKG